MYIHFFGAAYGSTSLANSQISGDGCRGSVHADWNCFKEIAKLTNADFVDRHRSLNEEALKRDVIGQIWRNSEKSR